MERLGDVGNKIEAHLKGIWGRRFLCTTQQVRESITVSLLGIRTKIQSEKPLARAELLYILQRTEDALDQVRVLLGHRDRRHVKTFIRIVRGYQRQIDQLLKSSYGHHDTRGTAKEGE